MILGCILTNLVNVGGAKLLPLLQIPHPCLKTNSKWRSLRLLISENDPGEAILTSLSLVLLSDLKAVNLACHSPQATELMLLMNLSRVGVGGCEGCAIAHPILSTSLGKVLFLFQKKLELCTCMHSQYSMASYDPVEHVVGQQRIKSKENLKLFKNLF